MEEYSKKDSTFIAGCAIIMMFYYHFFAFPEFLPKPDCYYATIKYLGVPVQEILAHFGQLCVAIFAFNSGYVLSKKRVDFNNINVIAKRATNFLISYWVVCLLFIIVGLICNSKLPDTSILLQNLVGLNVSARSDYVNVAHAWYVTYYLLFLLLCPLIVSNKIPNSKLLDIFLLLLVATLLQVLPEYVQKIAWPLPASITGYLVSKYKLFTVMGGIRRGRYTIIISVLVLFVMVIVRHESFLINKLGAFDGIFAFGTILSLKTLLYSIPQLIKRGVIWIGTYGMFYWFLHSAFVIWRSPLLEILYMPYYSVAITLWGIVLTTPLVFVCKWIATKIKTLLFKI